MSKRNVLENPHLNLTLARVLHKKQSIYLPITQDVSAPAEEIADAWSNIVLLNDLLQVFEAACELENIETMTAAEVLEEMYGKSIDELRKGDGLTAMAGKAIGTGAKTAKGWLNKAAEWIVEKTK